MTERRSRSSSKNYDCHIQSLSVSPDSRHSQHSFFYIYALFNLITIDMQKTNLTNKKLNELAFIMFGRGYGACNADEKKLLVESIDIKIPHDQILCERGHDGSCVCSAIIGGVRQHRVYMGYTKAYARRHFRNNSPK